MSRRNFIFILVGIVIVLGLLIFFADETGKETGNTPFASIEREKIDKIVIGRDDEEVIVIEKAKGGWLMTSPVQYKADQAVINAVLSHLIGLERKRVITNREELWNDYQVGKKAINIRVYSKDEVISGLIIGRTSDDNDGTFVRLKDKNQVFLAAGQLNVMSSLSDTHWRDKTILSFNEGDLEEIDYELMGKNYKLTYKKEGEKSVWYVDKKKANQEVISQMVKILSILTTNRFDDYKHEDVKYGFDKPLCSLEISLHEKKRNLIVGKTEDGGGYNFVRLGGGGQVFVVHSDTIKNICPPKAKILDK